MTKDIVSVCMDEIAQAKRPPNIGDSHLLTPVARKISARLFRAVKNEGKDPVFEYCEKLLALGDPDARLIAFDWAFRCRRHYTSDDFRRFEAWLMRYVGEWDSCDDFCTHAFGALIFQHPETADALQGWTQADGLWMRRGAAVVLIYAVRRETLFENAFGIAEALLGDREDLVQKGYGWLLKEVGNHAPQRVFDFVMARRETMPRTAFRYAIEKVDPSLRKRAMA